MNFVEVTDIGGGAYWAGRASDCPLFVPSGQALLLAPQLFCIQIDFLPFHVEHLQHSLQ